VLHTRNRWAIAQRLGADGTKLSSIVEGGAEAKSVVQTIPVSGGETDCTESRHELNPMTLEKQLFSEVERVFGSVDILVNNAGPPINHLQT